SPVMEKRMINLLIIVLRAVVAVANALIAVLELIRELID
ncbi:membrane protein, partial [Salmonella enterica subsp. enterica serovar Worthington str. BCH-7253]